jgi:ribonuclease-3
LSFRFRYLKHLFSNDRVLLQQLHTLLGFYPANLALYKLAFRHKSIAMEVKQGIKNSNERLEFLGDAILGAVVADLLFKKFPYKDEGFLTEMRSKIVSRENLNRLSVKIGLDKMLQTSLDKNNKSRSMSGDAFEALIGAIYLDKEYFVARAFILNRIIKNHVDIDLLEATEKNFKSKLLEWAQKERKIIIYELLEEDPTLNKQLKVRVMVDQEEKGIGIDFSKKKAEQLAAEEACKTLQL